MKFSLKTIFLVPMISCSVERGTNTDHSKTEKKKNHVEFASTAATETQSSPPKQTSYEKFLDEVHIFINRSCPYSDDEINNTFQNRIETEGGDPDQINQGWDDALVQANLNHEKCILQNAQAELASQVLCLEVTPVCTEKNPSEDAPDVLTTPVDQSACNAAIAAARKKLGFS